MKWLLSLPIIRHLIQFLKSIPLSKNAFSLYDLLELYISGLIKGTLTHRASAIAYSFFLAIFPFLLNTAVISPSGVSISMRFKLSAAFSDGLWM